MKKLWLCFALISLLISSCSEEEKKSSALKYVNSFVSESDETIIFGSISLDNIINKSDLTNLPNFGPIVGEQVKYINAGVGIKKRIYFALDGPLDREGMPSHSVLFMEVNNKDSLENIFSEMGYFFEDQDGLRIADDMNMSIGFNDEIAIFINTNFEEDPVEYLKTVYEMSQKGSSNEKIANILQSSSDIVFSSHMENLYGTSNTDLNKLPIKQQEEIKKLAAGSFVSTTIDFNDGELLIQSNSDFNEDLQELMFFKEDVTFDAKEKLGPGKAIMAFSMEIDIPKLERMIENFYPEATQELYKSMGTSGTIMKGLGGDGLSAIVDGKFGFAITGMPESMDMGAIPEMAFFAGLGKSSSDIVDLLVDLAASGDIQKVGKGMYRMGDASAKVTKDEVMIHSNANKLNEMEDGKTTLELPALASGFGNKPLAIYLDLKMISESGIDIGSEEARSVLELADYIYIEGDNKTSKMVIKLKDDSKNVLKAVIDAMRSELEKMMNV